MMNNPQDILYIQLYENIWTWLIIQASWEVEIIYEKYQI